MTLPRTSAHLLSGLERRAARALAVLKALGAEHAEVRVDHGHTLSASVRGGALELLSEAASQGLALRVVCGGRVATVTTSDLRPDALDVFLARAVELAALAEEDPQASPPSPRSLARRWTDLDLFDPGIRRLTVDRATRLALLAEAAALRGDPRICASGGAVCTRTIAHSLLATSGGFVGPSATTRVGLRAHVIAADAGRRRSGHYWSGGRHLAHLEPPEAVGREAAHRAVRSLGAAPIPTGVYPVVFSAEAAAGVVGLVAGCLLGDAVARGRSYLARRLGTRVASPHVTLVDDPLRVRGPASRAFDGEGRATRRNVLVRSGELVGFLLDTQSARRLDLKPNASAAGGGGTPHPSASNFYLRPGRRGPRALLEGVRRGLYVRTTLGHGFDTGTGHFSRGAEGVLIEDGELTRPVAEITISRHLDELLHGIDAVASDFELRTAFASPSFRVDAMTIAGT
ncbi:MAG: TldD/PmbA family protein [Myxococcales bacterium]|nr:TldD/PmbA family protein [Myxococcales bacterium]